MIKAIFFDFDGTVCDTRSIVSEESLQVLEEASYKVNKSEVAKYLGLKFEKFAEKFGVVKNQIENLRQKFYKKMIERVKTTNLMSCVDLKPIYDLKKKYLIVVVSNAESDFTKACIKKLKIEDLFREIHGAEAFETKDRIMALLFEKYNLEPKEVLYVGDRFSDIEYARKAKCWSVAIHNNCSWSTMQKIIDKKPDFIIADFYDLEKLIEKLNKIS